MTRDQNNIKQKSVIHEVFKSSNTMKMYKLFIYIQKCLYIINVKYIHSTFDSLVNANIGFALERKVRD